MWNRRGFGPHTLLILMLWASTASAAPIVTIDTFTGPFPPNPGLPNTGRPVLFVGPYCDGAACPPDPWGVDAVFSNSSLQSNVPGLLPGATRFSYLGGHEATAEIRGDLGLVEVRSNRDSYNFWVTYGTMPGEPELNLNFVSAGVGAIRFEIAGEANTFPLRIGLSFWQGDLQHSELIAYASPVVNAQGPVLIPLSAFTFYSALDFTDVDEIDVVIDGCSANCAGVEAVGYSLGPLTLESLATPAVLSSWGQLKSRYR